MAYEVALPPELEHIHNVFHVSVLCPYKPDYRYVKSYEPIQVEKDLTYEEVPVKIVDKKEHVLRNKIIPSVKVIWKNHDMEEATWELENKMRQNYPQLFE